MKRIAIFCGIITPSMFALAAEADPANIVVTAKSNETPNAIAVAPNTLRAQQAATSDTASLLRDVPGVSRYGAGGTSSLPVIHGLADDRLRIKVDGMDLIASCPNHMNPALSYLDPSNVAKLKVYAGISPVSVGGDSIGGTILAETPAPEFAAAGAGTLLKGEVGAFYRSNGGATGGNISATVATESFNLSYSGSAAKSDNYKAGGDFKTRTDTGRPGHTLPLDEVGSTAYDTQNQSIGVAFKSGQHLIEAKFGYQNVPEQLFPNQRMDMLENTQHRANLRYVGDFDWGSLEARAYRETVEHYMNFGADKQLAYGTAINGMPMNTKGKTTGGSIKASINLSLQDLLRIGGEVQHYTLNDWWPPSGTGMMSPNTFININDGERNRTALFGEWENQLSPQWMTLLGARYEFVTTNAGPVHGYNLATYPTVGVPAGMMNQTRDAANFNNADRDKTDNNLDLTALGRYTVNANYDIEFGLARKVRSPNLYERYSWSTANMMAIMNNYAGDGNGYIGDINLKPEKAYAISATFDWHAANREWEFKTTPYYTRVSDYIDAIKTAAFTANQFNVLQFANQSARLYGLDVSGHMPLARTSFGEFGLKGLLSYTNGKNRDTGDDLYNIMPLNAKLMLTQQLGAWDNSAELVMVKAKDQVSDVRNEIQTAGYSLVNLRASYQWRQARIDFGVENLFDKRYDLPLGGAYVGQGSTMALNAANMPWGIAVPGAGRSLYAGLNFKF